MTTSPSLHVAVLGTGGPFLRSDRVSSGYALVVDGTPRVLLDPGGGSFARAGEMRLDLSAIDLVAFTHTHIDHTGDIPAFIFAMYMQERRRDISFCGPTGRDAQPGCGRFVDQLFGAYGAWSYMQTFDGFATRATEICSNVESTTAVEISSPIEDLRIRAVAVPHGMMPALAYRFDYGNVSLSFSGDIARLHEPFVELARDTSLLIHDMALPEREVPHGHLHAKPTSVGETAARSNCGRLALTHFLPEIDDAIAVIRTRYRGPIVVLHDRQTVAV